VLGSIYALVALGYTMVYGILGLINFAHGEVVMVGALVAISVIAAAGPTIGVSPALLLAVGLALAVLACMALGALLERVAYRPLRSAPRLTALITAIGMSIVIQNLAMLVWGRQYLPFPPLLPGEPMGFLGATVTPVQLVIVLCALASMVGLLWTVNRTRLGRAMRATAQSPALASLMGVNVDRIVVTTFLIGSALAALAGVMVAGYYGQGHYHMGFMLGLKAFTAAVLGGIGNIPGAMVGGLLLGVIESLGAGYIGTLTGGLLGSHYQDVFACAVLVAVLVFRPSGLLGERVADRA